VERTRSWTTRAARRSADAKRNFLLLAPGAPPPRPTRVVAAAGPAVAQELLAAAVELLGLGEDALLQVQHVCLKARKRGGLGARH
jgi:hypothetical protein